MQDSCYPSVSASYRQINYDSSFQRSKFCAERLSEYFSPSTSNRSSRFPSASMRASRDDRSSTQDVVSQVMKNWLRVIHTIHLYSYLDKVFGRMWDTEKNSQHVGFEFRDGDKCEYRG